MEILVFKTSLTEPKHVVDIGSDLDVHPNIIEWNVDLHDCDNILRVVSNNVSAQSIENLLLNAGYYCEELC